MQDFGEPIMMRPILEHQSISIAIIPLILALVGFVVQIAFTIAVYNDASSRRGFEQHVWFVSPIFWAGATLVGGAFVATAYWAMHYSTLATDKRPPAEPIGESAD